MYEVKYCRVFILIGYRGLYEGMIGDMDVWTHAIATIAIGNGMQIEQVDKLTQ